MSKINRRGFMQPTVAGAVGLAVMRNTTPSDVPLSEVRSALAQHNAIVVGALKDAAGKGRGADEVLQAPRDLRLSTD